jgi:hypothetical protein
MSLVSTFKSAIIHYHTPNLTIVDLSSFRVKAAGDSVSMSKKSDLYASRLLVYVIHPTL